LLPGDYQRPPGTGVRVEPLGEGLISVLPEGFRALLAPAAALPAPLDAPLALPVVVPAGDPVVVPLVAAPPVLELPLAEPAPDCASAYVLVRASAVASPNVASFMIAPCCCFIIANEVRQHAFPWRFLGRITVGCCSLSFPAGAIGTQTTSVASRYIRFQSN
jgi:hypothetical protein